MPIHSGQLRFRIEVQINDTLPYVTLHEKCTNVQMFKLRYKKDNNFNILLFEISFSILYYNF